MFLGALVVLAAATAAQAIPPDPPATPEIDPGFAAGAIALLAGCVAMLRARIAR